MDYEKVQVKGSDILSFTPKQNREYRVKAYDFRRPDKFSMEQIRTVSIIHETFARFTSASLSALLRNKVQLNVSCVDQLNFQEFIQSIPNPTTMAILQMTPLYGSAILEINPKISSSIIDRVSGGRGESSNENRENSSIERELMAGVIMNILENLKVSWSQVVDLAPTIGQMETKPHLVQIIPPGEMIILVTFDITIGDVKGTMNLCIPYLTIEPIIGKLSAQYWYSSIKKNDKEYMTNQMVSSLKMDSEIITKTENLSLKHLGSLKKGSLIKLDGFHERTASLRMGGEILLPAQLKRIRKGLSCIFENDLDIQKITAFELIDKETKQDHVNYLNESIKDLSTQIIKSFTGLNLRIEKIADSQDHLNDQVFLQSNSEQSLLIQDRQPFSFIGFSDLVNLYQLVAEDHHQVVALILSRLKSELGARLLEMFPLELQPDLIRRVGKIDRVAPVIIEKIEKILQDSISRMEDHLETDVEGIEKVTEILNVISRSVEKNVIISLEKTDSELAENIKNRMFVFEDIIMLDSRTVETLVEKADFNDLCLAMKIVNEEKVKDHIYNSISSEKKKQLIEGIENLGRVKISDVDKAQLRIVVKIREMEVNGEVIVCRPDDMVE